MTTTAHENQYLAAPEPVREPMSREAILRRNIADMEVALRTQTELKEKAEAELAKLAKQEPVTYVFDPNGYAINGKHIEIADALPTGMDLYAAPVPVPAPAVPYGVDEEAANRIALAVYDCKHGINQEPLLYAINRILATEAHPLSAEGQRSLLQSAERSNAAADRMLEGGE